MTFYLTRLTLFNLFKLIHKKKSIFLYELKFTFLCKAIHRRKFFKRSWSIWKKLNNSYSMQIVYFAEKKINVEHTMNSKLIGSKLFDPQQWNVVLFWIHTKRRNRSTHIFNYRLMRLLKNENLLFFVSLLNLDSNWNTKREKLNHLGFEYCIAKWNLSWRVL